MLSVYILDNNFEIFYRNKNIYCIAGEFGRRKVWRIGSFHAFGERKFGVLIDQPIGYSLYCKCYVIWMVLHSLENHG